MTTPAMTTPAMTTPAMTTPASTHRPTRLIRPALFLSALALAAGCGSQTPDPVGGGGGTVGVGGTPAAGGAGAGRAGTGGLATGGATTTGGAPATGGATGGTVSTGGVAGSGGAAQGGGSGGETACSFECVDQCVTSGGTPQPGACSDGMECCEISAPADPFAHLRDSAEEVGLLLANRFRNQNLAFGSVANLPGDGYKTACEWYGSLGVAKLTQNQPLLDGLVMKFDPLETNFVQNMLGGEKHVDRYIFGMVPLEIYLQTDDESYLPLGIQVADDQQITNQTRDAIDDMFMMTGLQLQAYRATGETKYLDFMSDIMVDYLDAQRMNGLFFHNVSQAPIHWGRGNGWFAAGLAEMMRDLPTSHANYPAIESGYKKMMAGLLTYQSPNGLWYQVLDMGSNPSNWEETSGSAMFTYAMIAGVKRGVLDAATYVPIVDAAWAGIQTKINGQGDVSDICIGTWYHPTAQEYMALTRLTGDGHGQAPVLWAAAEILR